MNFPQITKSALACLIMAAAQTGTLAQGHLEQGKAFYAEGRLDKAQRCFAAELVEDPHDAAAHYLMANVYLAMQHTSLAVTEYRKSATLDPRGQAGLLSRKALASIASEGQSESVLVSGSTQGDAPSASTNPASELRVNRSGAKAETSTPSEDYTRTSASTISRETNERAAAIIAERDALIKHILAQSDERLKSVEKEMYERININGSSSAFVTSAPGQPVTYTRYAESIRSEYKPQLDAIKAEAQRKIDDTTSYYRDRAAAIEDNAISLDKAYVTPSGGTRLNPLGTNTYVRSYETSDEASGSPVPVQAAPPKSLKLSASSPFKRTGKP